MIMKELALKYGCNPNQKPSRIFMEGDQGASHHSTERQTGLHQFHGRVKRLAAGKRAEGSHRASGRRIFQACFTCRGGSGPAS